MNLGLESDPARTLKGIWFPSSRFAPMISKWGLVQPHFNNSQELQLSAISKTAEQQNQSCILLLRAAVNNSCLTLQWCINFHAPVCHTLHFRRYTWKLSGARLYLQFANGSSSGNFSHILSLKEEIKGYYQKLNLLQDNRFEAGIHLSLNLSSAAPAPNPQELMGA